jgi:predicted PurR-regulated permease PerM
VSEIKDKDRASIIDAGLARLQVWGIRIIVIAIALYIIGWVVGRTWMIWFPVSLAVLFATVLAPPTRWMRSKGLPAPAAAGFTMAGFLAILAALFSILIPQLVNEAPNIANQAAQGLNRLQDWLVDGPLDLEQGQITNMLNTVEGWLKDSAVEISGSVVSTIGAATGFVVNFVVIMMLTFFFIKDGSSFLPFVRRVGGDRVGGHLAEVVARSWETLGGFIRTQGLVAMIDAVLIGVGMVAVGQKLWLPLAFITFIGGFVPIVGAFASGALAVLVTLVTNGTKEAIIVGIVIVVVQQLEGNVLSPMLQGKSMNLHPAIVLLSVTAGGSLFGITGAFLAVPVVATVASVIRYIDERVTEEVASPTSTETALPEGESLEDDRLHTIQ